MGLSKGYVHIYTGNGKGKTTAGLGLALRAAGAGLRVCVFQFLKAGMVRSGELRCAVKGLTITRFEERYPSCASERSDRRTMDALGKAVRKHLALAHARIRSSSYDVVVLDEVLNAVRNGFVDEKTLIRILHTKPARVELVLTGRGSTRRLIRHADYVTECKKIKHPYDASVKARRGIEW